MVERSTSSWRTRAARIASGSASQRRVEPSMSVNKNVTVPDGGCTPTAPERTHADRPAEHRNALSQAHLGTDGLGGTRRCATQADVRPRRSAYKPAGLSD